MVFKVAKEEMRRGILRKRELLRKKVILNQKTQSLLPRIQKKEVKDLVMVINLRKTLMTENLAQEETLIKIEEFLIRENQQIKKTN